jgi:cell division cycle 14
MGSQYASGYLDAMDMACDTNPLVGLDESVMSWHAAPRTLLTYVKDRLYLASYTVPPTEDTLFPYPAQQSSRRSPSKRSARAADGLSSIDKNQVIPYYFCVDDSLLYNAFHHDFGPLHIGHLYRFAVQFHDILGADANKGKPVVFWSKADARSMFYLTPSAF